MLESVSGRGVVSTKALRREQVGMEDLAVGVEEDNPKALGLNNERMELTFAKMSQLGEEAGLGCKF